MPLADIQLTTSVFLRDWMKPMIVRVTGTIVSLCVLALLCAGAPSIAGLPA